MNARKIAIIIFSLMLIVGLVGFGYTMLRDYSAAAALDSQMDELNEIRRNANNSESKQEEEQPVNKSEADKEQENINKSEASPKEQENDIGEEKEDKKPESDKLVMLKDAKALYDINSDYIGWLTIPDTNIDYPVMQTISDEEYYLYRDFYGEDNKNGCLFVDTCSEVGIGTRAVGYKQPPSTNILVYGHTMKTGNMFGRLSDFEDYSFYKEHSKIYFSSLYEQREYEVLSAFYSKVYKENEDAFKFYQFFQADNEEEFNHWYNEIMNLSLYDTGATAEYGDEFLTLTCCSHQTEDGRFAVIAKRI